MPEVVEDTRMARMPAAQFHTSLAALILPCPQTTSAIDTEAGLGSWFGYLDRQGNVAQRFKGGPYKGKSRLSTAWLTSFTISCTLGYFHVPRCLHVCLKLLDELVSIGHVV